MRISKSSEKSVCPQFRFRQPTTLLRSPFSRSFGYLLKTGDFEVVLARWGLIPFWSKEAKIGYSTFNARAEELHLKPAFRDSLNNRRCLVPANCFYEWQKLGAKEKRPFAIGMDNNQPIAFDGLWDRWRAPGGTVVESFTIATVVPNELMRAIHDRMAASERFLSLDECRRRLLVADRRDNLILRLFIVCGFRPAELFALRTNDLQPGLLHIDQTVIDYKIQDRTKTEGSKANVPLPPELEVDLRALVRDEGITDLLFPREAGTAVSHHNYLDRTLKQLGILAEIDVIRNDAGEAIGSGLNHQVLRRTTATHFQKHGKIKDTQVLLRHERASTTLEHYQKELPGSVIEAVGSWYSELMEVPRKEPGKANHDASGRRRRVN